jgi:hypothetical protein
LLGIRALVPFAICWRMSASLTSSFNGNHGTFIGDVTRDGRSDIVAANSANITAVVSAP